MRPVDVEGVRVQMPSNEPVVLLRDKESGRVLPIWIGAVEATAIALAQQGLTPPRPLTHDLLIDLIAAVGQHLREVRVTALRDGVYYALLILDSEVEVSARPSDAIALALRAECPVLVADEVLDEAAISAPREEEQEVEKFREFLDHVSPEDFDSGAGG